MSQQLSPPWGGSFAPLFRGPSAGQQMRVSDAEREAVTDQLAGHYAEGRLDHNEFDKRVGQAMGAKTRADLNGLFADLPANRGSGTLHTSQPTRLARPRHHGHPVLLLVLAVVIFLAAAHALVAGPWLWVAFAAAAVLYMTRGIRRTAPGHQR